MSDLTPVQRKAAEHYTGPAIVMAGPGSGKTRVLIDRIRFLIRDKGAPPSSILAVTFTDKAAAQMQTRLHREIGDEAESVHVSTIHSLCRTIMEEYFFCHPFGASFTVMDAETQRLFVNAHRRDLGIDGEHGWLSIINRAAGHERDNEAQVCAFYNAVAEHRIDLNALEAGLPRGLHSDDYRALIRSCAIYEDLIHASKVVDFARLQSTALAILSSHPEALAGVRARYVFSLVDEYQDTSPAQADLIRLIAGDLRNVFVVGDENQSIYGFRGADVTNFRNFHQKYPKAQTYSLMTNFRSDKTIVEAANLLLESKIKEKLEAHRAKGNDIILVTGETREETARNAVAFIKMKIDEGTLKTGDAAFLYRKKCLAEDIHRALRESGLPFVTDSEGGLLDRPEARDLVNIFSYVHQKSVAESEFRNWSEWWKPEIFSNEIISLSGKTIKVLNDLPRDRMIGEAVTEEKVRALGVTDKKDARVIAALNTLKTKAKTYGLLESIFEIFKISGCLGRLLAGSSRENEEKLSRLARITRLVQKYEASFARPSAKNLLWLFYNKTLEGDDGAHPDADAAVKCMTVHKAKGLEFPAVVICSLLEGDFPLRFRNHDTVCGVPIPRNLMKTTGTDEEEHDAEELRLFYVAVTRAQDLLVLCVPEKINVRKGTESRFVKSIEKYVTGRVDSRIVVKEHYQAPPKEITLSYSAAHTYCECPFVYKLVYRYGFAAPADEEQKHGVIVHNVLQKVNWALQHDQPVDEKALEAIISESWVTIHGPKRDIKHKENYLKRTLAYVNHAREHFSAIESFEKAFTYVDGEMIVRGKTDLVAKDKDGRRLLIDFKARTMKGIEETGVEDQLRVYHHCLKDPGIEYTRTYTFFDNGIKDFPPDDRAADKFLKDVARGLTAESFPRHARNKDTCKECKFDFICEELKDV